MIVTLRRGTLCLCTTAGSVLSFPSAAAAREFARVLGVFASGAQPALVRDEDGGDFLAAVGCGGWADAPALSRPPDVVEAGAMFSWRRPGS